MIEPSRSSKDKTSGAGFIEERQGKVGDKPEPKFKKGDFVRYRSAKKGRTYYNLKIANSE